MQIELTICHGSLNKFVMIDEISYKLDISDKQRQTLSKNLCSSDMFDADGVLFLQCSSTQECQGKMSMYNSDGSEAQMCGNGIRCVARAIWEKDKEKEQFYIQTKNDKIYIQKASAIYKNIPTFDALISPVDLNIGSLPMAYNAKYFINKTIEGLDVSSFSAISVQNPHIVFIKDTINQEEIIQYGKILNSKELSLFPEQVNVNFVKIIDDSSIYVLTNERGSGITLSCGTGMSSSSYIVCELGYFEFGKQINVYNDGGMVICQANKDKNIDLIGNATYTHIYEIDFNDKMSITTKALIARFGNEIAEYEEFRKTTQQKAGV